MIQISLGRGRPSRIRGGRPERRGGDPSPRHDVARNLRAAGGQAYAGALSRSSLPISARPRAEGIYSRTLRRDGDLALLPRIRAGAPAIPARALACCRDHRRDGRLLGLPSINSSARRRNASGMVMPNDSPCRAIIAREADEVTSSSVSFRDGDGYDVARKTHFRNCATVTSAPSVSQAPARSASSDRLDPGKANAPPAPACGSR
jgi:hypothetical protein